MTRRLDDEELVTVNMDRLTDQMASKVEKYNESVVTAAEGGDQLAELIVARARAERALE